MEAEPMNEYGEPWTLRRTPKTWQIDCEQGNGLACLHWRDEKQAELMTKAPGLMKENRELRAMVAKLKAELTKALETIVDLKTKP